MAITLLLFFALKHWLADREWQTLWMVEGKRKEGWAFVVPLAAHAGIHAALTFYVLFAVANIPPTVGSASMVLLSLFDFTAHFSMDRLKGVMTRPYSKSGWGERDTPRSPWTIKVWTLVDQTVHGMTYLVIIWILTA